MFARSTARSLRVAAKSSARQYSSFSAAGVRSSKFLVIAPVAAATAGLTWYSFATPVLNDIKEESAATTAVPKESASAEASEEGDGEKSQSAAYNPETGEINWDCPCLGGMADGPCGEEFKAAFSCFVYSEADPKGYDCIDKFKAMQDCFRKYPEVYSEELRDEDELPIEDKPVETAVDDAVEVAKETVVETVDKVAETVPEVIEAVSETAEKVEEIVAKDN